MSEEWLSNVVLRLFMNSKSITILSGLLCLALSCACGKDEASSTTTGKAGTSAEGAVSAAGRTEAKELFQSLCFTCHGASGKGDGPGSAALDPKPRSFADQAWHDSVTDQDIAKVIVFGGAAVGKSPMMPGVPHLKGKQSTIDALVAMVRGFRAQ